MLAMPAAILESPHADCSPPRSPLLRPGALCRHRHPRRRAGPKQYVRVAGAPMVGAHAGRARRRRAAASRLLVVARARRRRVRASGRPARPASACGRALRRRTRAPRRWPTGSAALLQRGAAPRRLGAGARRRALPDASRSWIDRLIDACADDPVGGLLAMPVADTLKREQRRPRGGDAGRATDKWQAQTPQMFRLGMLRDALEARAATRSPTKPARSRRWACRRCWCLGASRELQAHLPADFALAERVLRARSGELA